MKLSLLLLSALLVNPARAEKACIQGDVECLIGALKDSELRWNAMLTLKDLATIRSNGKLAETTKPLKSAVPALEQELADPKGYIQIFAATAILAIDPENTKALKKLTLAISDPLKFTAEANRILEIYQSASHGLSRAKALDDAAANALFSILTSTGDVGRVQLAASKALIATGHKDLRIVEALRSSLRSEHPGVRSASARELRNLGAVAAPAVPDLASIVVTATGQDLRLVASGVLADLHVLSLPAIPSFLSAIKSRDAAPEYDSERWTFIRDLVKIGIPESDNAALSLNLDRFGHRIATLAILHQRKYLFDEILRRNPSVINEFDALSKTLLHDAARMGRIEFVRTLLAKGANPNAQKNGFSTPIGDAAVTDEAQVINILLEAGADASIGSMDGTPLERARKYKKMKAVEALEAKVK